MATSNEKPDWHWLRKLEKSEAYLRIRWNVEEKQVEDGDGNYRTQYEYDEEEIVVPIPQKITTVENLKQHLNDNKETYMQIAQQKKEERATQPPPEEQTETIRTMDIKKLRKSLKEEEVTI